jgi:hypothetical protein
VGRRGRRRHGGQVTGVLSEYVETSNKLGASDHGLENALAPIAPVCPGDLATTSRSLLYHANKHRRAPRPWSTIYKSAAGLMMIASAVSSFRKCGPRADHHGPIYQLGHGQWWKRNGKFLKDNQRFFVTFGFVVSITWLHLLYWLRCSRSLKVLSPRNLKRDSCIHCLTR